MQQKICKTLSINKSRNLNQRNNNNILTAMKGSCLFFFGMFFQFFFFVIPKMSQSQNEEFQGFIKRFVIDSVFQIDRISFPLTYITWDYENDHEITIQLEKTNYKFDRLYYSLEDHSDAYPIFYDNFECKFRDTGEMVFRWVGFTSVDRRYYFNRIDGKWILIKILDYDPIN